MNRVLLMTASDLPLRRIARGKVRDVYEVDDDRLLLVATDRVSAYDVVMAEPIPMKGAVLTQVSAWWFRQLGGLVKHHMISAHADEIIAALEVVASGATYLSPGVSGRLFRNQSPRPVLTPRESDILAALGRGESSKQIAARLNLSFRTVEAHRQNIKRKLGIEGQAELIKYAVECSAAGRI